MFHRALASLACGAVLLVLAAPAWAAAKKSRTDCSPLLVEAEERYRGGRLEAARDAVNTCLRARPSKGFKIASLELLAKIELVLDNTAGASQAVRDLLTLEPDYQADPLLPERFQRLVAEARGARGEVQVMSVSKSPESLRKAPATVQVITAEEIRRRGYLDLEQLLHDLPGFDISRGNGTFYSHVYQRGYRSESTDRTLLLIDGVEHNDLQNGAIWLSRQYPLSNVDRVEVVYGPASTMYGANAFAGVINVLTKTPEQLIAEGRAPRGDDPESQLFSVTGQAGSGSFSTRWVDATLAGRTPGGGISFSLTGRLYRSDERDLSGFADWDFSPNDFLGVDYGGLLGLRGEAAEAFRQQHGDTSPFYTVGSESGTTVIGLTEAGRERAIRLDQAALETELGGDPVGFSDLTDDWFVGGKLIIRQLEVGFQTWQRREGMSPWYLDSERPGAKNGSVWAPESTSLYVKFDHEISQDLDLLFFSRFKVHTTNPESSSFALRNYAGGDLGLSDLVSGTEAHWLQTRTARSSNQLRNEISLIYAPSPKWSLVTGVELRNGSIQGDSSRSTSSAPNELPGVPTEAFGNFDVRDLGIFAQAAFRPTETLKLVAGGRYDHNDIDPVGGYGDVFNPRLGVIWSPGGWTLKAIWSEAFKDASNFTRFVTNPGTRDLANPALQPETVENLELAASWQGAVFQAEVALYDASYSNVVGLRTVPFGDGTTSQFQNIGALEIRGLQASGRFDLGRFDLYANYTFTDPLNTQPLDADGEPRTDIDELRIGDIAEHRLNAGLHADLWRRLEGDLRLNWVGSRRTGEGTTVDSNPFTRIDAYTTADLSVTYKALLPGLDLQLTVDNLFDEDYYHPGIRQAGDRFAARLPQPGRAAFVRALVRY